MAVTVRDLIIEAAARANINPRAKRLTDDVFTSGLLLLRGILQDYSTRNYIVAYKSEVDFDPKVSVLVGEGPDAEVYAPKIMAPQTCLFQPNSSLDWTKLDFISYDQFYSDTYNDYIVSWQPVQANLYKIYLKPRFAAQNRKCKLIYNVEMQLEDNDTVTLPTPYIELLTRALAYKLAISFPRADTTKMNLLKNELDELENSLAAANSSNRIITRDNGYKGSLFQRFNAGSFIW